MVDINHLTDLARELEEQLTIFSANTLTTEDIGIIDKVKEITNNKTFLLFNKPISINFDILTLKDKIRLRYDLSDEERKILCDSLDKEKLGRFYDYFTKWIMNNDLPYQCKYKLDSIGYASREVTEDPRYERHLQEDSKQRFMIDKVGYNQDYQSYFKMRLKEPVLYLREELGLRFVTANLQSEGGKWWSRYLELIDDDPDNPEDLDSGPIWFFIIDPNIEDTNVEEIPDIDSYY